MTKDLQEYKLKVKENIDTIKDNSNNKISDEKYLPNIYYKLKRML